MKPVFVDTEGPMKGWYVSLTGDITPFLIQGFRGESIIYDGSVDDSILGPYPTVEYAMKDAAEYLES